LYFYGTFLHRIRTRSGAFLRTVGFVGKSCILYPVCYNKRKSLPGERI
jgi:hypothetical protein